MSLLDGDGEQAGEFGQLLDEDPAMVERRQQCWKRLELYKSARDEIDSLAWSSSSSSSSSRSATRRIGIIRTMI
jgi:hypothetical protein